MTHAWEKSLLDKGLQCSICIDFFHEPLTLDCGHTFCRLCLLQSTRLAPDGRRCPECRATIEIKDPLGHATDSVLEEKIAQAIPAEVLAARKATDEQQLEALAFKEEHQLPVFYMRGVASKVGERVALHFFEPRYKILIRRAWEGSRRFVCTSVVPRKGDTGLVVQVENASFLSDGRANINGRGVEVATLGQVWIEDGTEGLYHAELKARNKHTDVPEARHSVVSESQVRQALTCAIRNGAPAYNRGDVERCAQLYRSVAEELLRNGVSRETTARLQSGLHEAQACGTDHDKAAWALRHAFDDIISQQPSSSSRSWSGEIQEPSADIATVATAEDLELPLFYMDSSEVAAENRLIRLRLFEHRYRILARETWESHHRLFIYGMSVPRRGGRAMLVHIDECSFDARGDACIRGTSVALVRLDDVRHDADKGDLCYATCAIPTSALRGIPKESSERKQPKCCTIA